jgi:hypothetical protein
MLDIMFPCDETNLYEFDGGGGGGGQNFLKNGRTTWKVDKETTGKLLNVVLEKWVVVK